MSAMGRNAPCPCGSGRKFKKCCGSAAATSDGYTADDRERAFEKIAEALDDAEAAEAAQTARELLFGDWLDEPNEEVARLLADSQRQQAAFMYMLCDLGADEGHPTLADVFLERGALDAGERRFVRALASSHCRAFEILEIEPDVGLAVEDVLTGQRAYIRDRSLTRSLRPFAILVARALPEPDGQLVVEDVLAAFDSDTRVVEDLRQEWQAAQEEGQTLKAFFADQAPFILDTWFEEAVFRRPARLQTTDGEELVPTVSRWEVRDAEACARGLAGVPDVEQEEPGTWRWYRELDDGDRLTLGSLSLEGQELRLETMSRERADRGRAWIDARLGDAVAWCGREEESVGALMGGDEEDRRDGGGAPAEDPDDEVPPEVAGRVVREYLDRHYRAVLDQPVPMLDGMTPRQAAREAPAKAIRLLKYYESHGDGDDYDFGWMWHELGLQRPGREAEAEGGG